MTNEQDVAHGARNASRSKEFICKLFKAFSVLQCEDQLDVALQSFFRQPERYPLTTTLVPAAIELHKGMDGGSHSPLYSLLSHCVNTLQQESVIAPTWSKQADLMCCCKLCTELATFLKDPKKRVARYSKKQSMCTHLEWQLGRSRDVSYVTERVGKTNTLIVTKNQWRHQAKLELLRLLLNQLEKPLKRLKVEPPAAAVIVLSDQ